jgi:tRNA dimethylallyltransferase
MSIKKPFSQTRRQGKPLFNFLQIGIDWPKEKLRERIDKRIDAMVKTGLVDEVRNLTKKYPVGISAFDAIGYREIIDYLRGNSSLEKAIELMKKNTWQFAKRQMTWFRKDKTIHWIATEKQAEKLTKVFLV